MKESKNITVRVVTKSVITGEEVSSQEPMNTFSDFFALRAALISNYKYATLNDLVVVANGDMHMLMFNHEFAVFSYLQGYMCKEELDECLLES